MTVLRVLCMFLESDLDNAVERFEPLAKYFVCRAIARITHDGSCRLTRELLTLAPQHNQIKGYIARDRIKKLICRKKEWNALQKRKILKKCKALVPKPQAAVKFAGFTLRAAGPTAVPGAEAEVAGDGGDSGGVSESDAEIDGEASDQAISDDEHTKDDDSGGSEGEESD